MEEEEQKEEEYHLKLTKFEEDHMKKVKDAHKQNLVQKQVVAGREFKGTAFIAKPEVVLFKDFEVGKTYRQKVLVTNVSFSFNSFKVLPITDAYKDFFDLIYSPSGRMSAGLSTTIEVVFTPHVNADIVTVIPLLAETGPVDIPLECYCRKAIVKGDKAVLDFGNVIYGEEGKIKLVLTNSGALPVGFEVRSRDDKKLPLLKPVKLAPSQLAENLLKDQEKVLFPETVVVVEKQPPAKEEVKKEEEVAAPQPEVKVEETKKGSPSPKKAEVKKEETKKVETKKEVAKVPEPAIKAEEAPSPKKEEVKAAPEFPGQDFLAQIDFVHAGKVEGYSTYTITFTFIPITLGTREIQLLVKFDNDKYSPSFTIDLKGQCVEVPLYIDRPIYDFRICPYNCMYREKFILHNRGTRTMQLSIHCPKELSEFVEFNPTNGYIQPLSNFEIWAKFKPTPQIMSKCKRYAVASEQISVVLKVVSELQAVPVLFKLKSEFTTDELEISPKDIDFGCLYDQVAPSVRVTLVNHSKLPQKISFFQIPKEISAEPDKGSLHLLPLETTNFCLIYRPANDGFYGEVSGVMWLRVVTGNIVAKELKMTFTAKKEKCAILFDKSKILYPSLSEDETFESLLSVSLNVGVTKEHMIEFTPPHSKISGLRFCPTTALVKPGKPVLVQILYDAKIRNLDPFFLDDLKREVAEGEKTKVVLKNKLIDEEVAKQSEPVVEETKGKKKEGKKEEKKGSPVKKEEKKAAVKKTKKQEEEEELARVKEEERKKKEEEERKKKILADFKKDAELYKYGGKVYDNVSSAGQSQHYEWLVPCSFTPVDKQAPKTTFIYIKTVVSKATLLVSPKALDFGELAVSCRKVLYLDITNIDSDPCDLHYEKLTPLGGFTVLNAMRTISPKEKMRLALQFEPIAQQRLEENLVLYTDKTRSTVQLKGIGVRPEVSIEPENHLIDMGSVVVGEYSEATFTVKNLSSFAVVYAIKIEAKGLQNKGKESKIFSYDPQSATIQPGESATVTAKFAPDFQGESFYEKILVDIPNQINPKSLFLRGFGWHRQLSARTYEPFVFPEAVALGKIKPMDLMVKEKYNVVTGFRKTIMLEFTKIVNGAKLTEEEKEKETVRKIVIASAELVELKQDKPGSYEIFLQKDDYFSCDLPKGNLQPGQSQVIKFTYTPPKKDASLANIKAIQDVGQWVQTRCELKLIGGYLAGGSDTLIYDIVLRAYAEQIQ